MSGDEKKQLDANFQLGSNTSSENIFIERWYQLLRVGGKFVAVIPETVLDSSSGIDIRLFIFRYFKTKAIISLPYVAFKPFTSTKTCILFAEKKTDKEVKVWEEAWRTHEVTYKSLVKKHKSSVPSTQLAAARELIGPAAAEMDIGEINDRYLSDLEQILSNGSSWIFNRVVQSSDVDNYQVFLAEPKHVGYKRRKGLSDLEQPNDLMFEGEESEAVLNNYLNDAGESLRFGFRVNLIDFSARPSLRIDPKYVHLWKKRDGRIFASKSGLIELKDLLKPHPVTKLPKGPLESPRLLVDLANVESAMSIASGIEEVDEIGSDKIEFLDSDIAISKLEPYLGKVLINEPDQEWIGSPEWLTFKATKKVHYLDYVRFLLLTPEMFEAYRCLQSGKRHARMSEADFLSLKIPDVGKQSQQRISQVCESKMKLILEKRAEIKRLR